MLPGLFLAFPGGYLGSYFRDKSIISFGLLCLCAGGLIMVATNNFNMMSLGRTVCGVGFVLTTMYFSKVTIDWFEGHELATAMAAGWRPSPDATEILERADIGPSFIEEILCLSYSKSPVTEIRASKARKIKNLPDELELVVDAPLFLNDLRVMK